MPCRALRPRPCRVRRSALRSRFGIGALPGFRWLPTQEERGDRVTLVVRCGAAALRGGLGGTPLHEIAQLGGHGRPMKEDGPPGHQGRQGAGRTGSGDRRRGVRHTPGCHRGPSRPRARLPRERLRECARHRAGRARHPLRSAAHGSRRLQAARRGRYAARFAGGGVPGRGAQGRGPARSDSPCPGHVLPEGDGSAACTRRQLQRACPAARRATCRPLNPPVRLPLASLAPWRLFWSARVARTKSPGSWTRRSPSHRGRKSLPRTRIDQA